MRKIYTWILLLNAWVITANASDIKDSQPYFLSTTAKPGDGIEILLRRYDLWNYNTNLSKFLELNNLKKDDFLLASKDYLLPIKIYQYNGISIRSTLGVEDYQKAVRIQAYNEFLLRQNLRKSDFRSSKLLWVPFHELTPDQERAPEPLASVIEEVKAANPARKASSTLIVNSLFGEKYKEIPVEDNSLANQVFYISPGHGGPDPGTMCNNCPETMCEDEYAYDVCLRLARNLLQHGATVHVIIQDPYDGIRDEKYLECDHDEISINGKKIPLSQTARLQQRAEDINRLYAKHQKEGAKSQKAIMVHVDSRAADKRQDVFFYYKPDSKEGKELALNVYNTFESKYNKHRATGEYFGYVDERSLFMLRKVRPASVYVELANIKNLDDHKRLIHAYNRQALANWLMEGLIKK